MGLRVGDAVVFPVQQRFSASFQEALKAYEMLINFSFNDPIFT